MRTVLLALVALALLPASALAKTVTVSRHGVQATYADKGKQPQVHDQRLTIVRDGVRLFDAPPASERCDPDDEYPCFTLEQPLRVRDLDGDGEPEVVLELFTGGAHCCFQVLAYRYTGTGYEIIEHDFGDATFRLRDLDEDGVLEFRTVDPAFAYGFASYAFSGLPVQILRLAAHDLDDATNEFPAVIRRDARFWWRTYRRSLRDRDSEPRGPIAAWAADRYRLGKVSSTRRILRREARRGHLFGDVGGSPKRFIRRLDRFLHRRGYR